MLRYVIAEEDATKKIHNENRAFVTNVNISEKTVRNVDFKSLNSPKSKYNTNTLATSTLGAQITQVANKYAIIIGISNYPELTYDLKYSDDDAVNMERALKDCYGFKDKNIKKFIDRDGDSTYNESMIAMHENIWSTIDEIVSKSNFRKEEI